MKNWKRVLAAFATAALLVSNLGSSVQTVYATEPDRIEATADEGVSEQTEETGKATTESAEESDKSGTEATEAEKSETEESDKSGTEATEAEKSETEKSDKDSDEVAEGSDKGTTETPEETAKGSTEDAEVEQTEDTASNAKINMADFWDDDEAANDTYSVEVGGTVSITGSQHSGNNSHKESWKSSDSSIASVSSGNYSTATVTGNKAGTATITHTYYTQQRSAWGGTSYTQHTESFTVNVTEQTGTVKVYVYVSTKDGNGDTISDECLELLGISKDTIDSNGYFPAGEIELDRSFLQVRTQSPVRHYSRLRMTGRSCWQRSAI